MNILAHRGTWSVPAERNTAAAFARAWRAGHGIETDLRDLDGDVVVSHDPPTRTTVELSLRQLLELWVVHGRRGTLALNIKADGLTRAVAEELAGAGAADAAFMFDMSIPDAISYERSGATVYRRWSEREPLPPGTPVTGVWLDAFDDDGWWDVDEVANLLRGGANIALVSPELHGREHSTSWQRLRHVGLHQAPNFSLCTDHPAEAEEYFA